MRTLLLILAFTVFSVPALAYQTLPQDKHSAVILSYGRVGEDSYSDTNITIEQFASHLQEIKQGQYNILPLPVILNHLKTGVALPEHALAITFEGAYRSAYENAIPQLLEARIPFTVIFASDNADNGADQYMDWHTLNSLKKNDLVSFGMLPASYERLTGLDEAQVKSRINRARVRYREELGEEPKIFSYPFGQYSKSLHDLIKSQGFDAALALNSGAVYSESDLFALPRFAMTESHGDLDRFILVAHALPLPATHIEPESPVVGPESPIIGFTPDPRLQKDLGSLACFISGQGKAVTEIVGQDRVEIRPHGPLLDERTRVNCTMPAPSAEDSPPRWRWLGMLLVKNDTAPEPDDENEEREESDEEISTPPPDELQ